MRELNLEDVLSRFSHIKDIVEVISSYSEGLKQREESLDALRDELNKRRNEVDIKELALKKIKSEIEVEKERIIEATAELEKFKKDLSTIEARQRKIAVEFKKESLSIEQAREELKDLLVKKALLDEREEGLNGLEKDLAYRESVLKKEVIVDRERKEALRIAEEKLEADKKKIAKYL